MRILICDDDPLIIEQLYSYIQFYFEQCHIKCPEIVSFTCGEDLLADNGEKDLVFLDIEMPGMNGIELFRRMKAITGETENLNKDTPVIMMTADNTPEIKELVFLNGFAGYLGKPVTEEEIKSTILKYLPHDMVCETSKGGR